MNRIALSKQNQNKYFIYITYFFLFFLSNILIYNQCYSQVENVSVSHPVYQYLIHAEANGLLPHFSSSSLPLRREEICNCLISINKKRDKLSKSEQNTLDIYLVEFKIKPRQNAVVFYSGSDSTQIFIKEFFSDKEKLIYHYQDSSHSVSLQPLASVDGMIALYSDSSRNVAFGNLGFRLFGTLGNIVGYYLQATNGAIVSGDRDLALEETRMQQNVKFSELNSDFDFTESHVQLRLDWFYCGIFRETKLLGSGINQRLFISNNAPAIDAFSMGAEFENFEYTFMHASLISYNKNNINYGFLADICSKYMILHRFALKPSWGELSFTEMVIYSDRDVDLAYLNPLSFFKSLEHSLHDRDNSMIGADITVRPFSHLQIKGSYLLDDIIFSKIGTGFWSNKSAWNIGASYALNNGFDLNFEYSRIEPYMYTHFNPINSYTNDKFLLATSMLPNSDEFSLSSNLWLGYRYPLRITLGYQRHGANEYDSEGNLIKNVGADPFQTHRIEDPENVVFLDGINNNSISLSFSTGYEIIRGFNIQIFYKFISYENSHENIAKISFRFEDF